MKSLYCTLVKSILEYIRAVVWDQDTFCDMNLIELVQHKFLNFIAYKLKIDHPPYDYSIISNHAWLTIKLTEGLKLI